MLRAGRCVRRVPRSAVLSLIRPARSPTMRRRSAASRCRWFCSPRPCAAHRATIALQTRPRAAVAVDTARERRNSLARPSRARSARSSRCRGPKLRVPCTSWALPSRRLDAAARDFYEGVTVDAVAALDLPTLRQLSTLVQLDGAGCALAGCRYLWASAVRRRPRRSGCCSPSRAISPARSSPGSPPTRARPRASCSLAM